jgi:hypothetical protein
MAYMKGSDGIRLDTIPVKTRLDGLESLGDLIAGQFPAPDQRRLYGPVTVDMPDVNLNIAAANPP